MADPSPPKEASEQNTNAARGLGLRSIGVRAAIPMVLLVAVIAALAFVAQIEREQRSLLAAKDVAGRMVVRVMSSAAVAPLEFDDAETLAEELEYIRGDEEVVAAGVWRIEDGVLAAEPMAAFAKDGREAPTAPEIHENTDSEIHETIAAFSRPVIDSQGTRVGMALVELSLEREMETLATSEQLIQRVSVGVALAVTLLLLGQFRFMVVRPLSALMSAAQRVERGERARVDERRKDEFGRVAHAFNHMVAAIEDRERKIETKNAQLTRLFDNMRQAIFSVGPDRRLRGETSRATQELFGREVAGASLDELLLSELPEGSPDQEAFSLWLEAVFREGAAGWSEMEELAPNELHLRPGGDDEVFLSLEFRPIIEGGELRELMVLATDETDKRRLQRNAKELESRYEREMASMQKILAGGTQLFVDFLRSTGQRTRRCESIVGDTPRNLRAGEIEELFRHGHTIKGEARTFELLDLRDAAERLEDSLASARATLARGEQPPAARLHAELKTALGEMRSSYDRTRGRFVQASPLGEAILDQTTVSRSDLQALVERSREVGSATSPEMGRMIERLASRPFAESVLSLVDAVPTWAENIGKRAKLVYEGGDVRIPARLAETLPGVLTHLVRNSLSHGIEAPQGRRDAKKDSTGRIALRCLEGERGIEIFVEDDGAGLNDAALRAAAPGSASESAADLAFREGASTSKGDELSGRGVGLGAVRRDLEAAGFQVAFVEGTKVGTQLRIFPAVG